MDDVSNLKFIYNFVRKPKIVTRNLFAYAADLKVLCNDAVYLEIEDLSIIDFAIQLKKLCNIKCNYALRPIGGEDILLYFNFMQNQVIISSDFTKKLFRINNEQLYYYMDEFFKKLESDIGKSLEYFY